MKKRVTALTEKDEESPVSEVSSFRKKQVVFNKNDEKLENENAKQVSPKDGAAYEYAMEAAWGTPPLSAPSEHPSPSSSSSAHRTRSTSNKEEREEEDDLWFLDEVLPENSKTRKKGRRTHPRNDNSPDI